jgi:hypothetical protein
VELSNFSVRVEDGEEVQARYLPARVERLCTGSEIEYPEWLSLWFGKVSIAGRPAVVVELLGRALREAYAACGAGNPDGPDDGPAGPALAVVRKGGER